MSTSKIYQAGVETEFLARMRAAASTMRDVVYEVARRSDTDLLMPSPVFLTPDLLEDLANQWERHAHIQELAELLKKFRDDGPLQGGLNDPDLDAREFARYLIEDRGWRKPGS